VSLVVQKYGGSSVADAKSIQRVAKRIAAAKNAGHDVVVTVSAMGDSTDDLIDLAHQVSATPDSREMDMLLTTGERVAMSLLAMAIKDLGVDARSFTGSQAGMLTDGQHGRARIVDITPTRVRQALDENAVAIVAGFQGFNTDSKDITTLGRGGSDTTAVALAAVLGAQSCEIYTDVAGVFTADPRIVKNAQKVDWISYEEMLELAASGAKVIYIRAVEFARRHGVTLHVRSSFTDGEGTWISAERQGDTMEEPIITGVAGDVSEAKITVVGVPDIPGKAAEIFTLVAEAGANIDMIVQNVSAQRTGRTDISFTLPVDDGDRVMEVLTAAKSQAGFDSLLFDDEIGKLSVVGAGMRTNVGVSAQLFTALSDAGINIEMISTSEIRISLVMRADALQDAIRVVHTAFGLDGLEEAIVHAGTGR